MTNRLDNFIPFFLGKVEEARRHNFPRFQIHHANGDRIEVQMPLLPGGEIRATRYVGETEWVLVKLVVTEAQLREDLRKGISSKQAELLRG